MILTNYIKIDYLIIKYIHKYINNIIKMPKCTKYTLEEVKSHNIITDGWIIINNYVYDITPLLNHHNPSIISVLGKDATDTFKLFHNNSFKIKLKLKKYLIGKIKKPHKRTHFSIFNCFT